MLGEPLTIGYGVGAGSKVNPFGFYVGDDYTMDIGFFKLLLFEEPVGLQNIVQQESVFVRSRGMMNKPFLSRETSFHPWGSITMVAIQRGRSSS